MALEDPFLVSFKGGFTGILRWPQLDALWHSVREDADGGWYIYAVGDRPPDTPSSGHELTRFLDEIDKLLRTYHEEDYCGIVYADDRQRPTLVKIYDPKNLGVVCGFSDSPPLPGWLLSKLKPVDLTDAFTPPLDRRRWWQRIFG